LLDLVGNLAFKEWFVFNFTRLVLLFLTLCHVLSVDFQNLLQVWVPLHVVVVSFSLDLAIFEHDYSVCEVQKVDGVCNEYACPLFEQALEDLFEDLLTDVSI